MNSFISISRFKKRFSYQKNNHPEKPLRLLLIGYMGAQNVGSDVRAAEIVRQFQHVLKDIPSEITIASINPTLTQHYFDNAKQVRLPHVFPPFILQECPKYDGIITCEGSMFKSKFSTALSTMMASALGIANAHGLLSVGYGAEAGDMEVHLKNFVKKQCKNSLIICRNDQSRAVLTDLNIRTSSGTDTAWTFTPAPSTHGLQLLREAGWDEKTKILAIAPINPFWWPVTPNLKKYFVNGINKKYKDTHYQSIYFHEYKADDKTKFHYYIESIASAVLSFQQQHRIFPIVIGMERLDVAACNLLAEKLGGHVPTFLSVDFDKYTIVSLLRQANLLLSSRYHAIVTSMPALVPSAGITMDERIHNLMHDRKHVDLLLHTDEDHLQDKVLDVLNRLYHHQDQISQDIAHNVSKHIRQMGEMGCEFMQELQRIYPHLTNLNVKSSWENYLPPLSHSLYQMMETSA